MIFGDDIPGWALVPVLMPFLFGVFIPPIWILLAANIKRLHDHDKSGWWQFVLMIPIFGWIYGFALLGCCRGTEEPNRYGAPVHRRCEKGTEIGT